MTPARQTSKIGEIGGRFLLVYRRVVIHWHAIVLLLVLACVAFLVARFDEFVPFVLIGFALLLIFIASQIFWIGRILDLGERCSNSTAAGSSRRNKAAIACSKARPKSIAPGCPFPASRRDTDDDSGAGRRGSG